MSNEDIINELESFKSALMDWQSTNDEIFRTELRSYINQNKITIRTHVAQVGCLQTITISPPPAVGGLVMQNVDPFDMIFNPPYLMNMVPVVTDMIDQAIGVWKTGGPSQTRQQETPKLETRHGYVFVAMPMDPDDPGLVDVLDAIKEAASRCGLFAERVDEPQSNERITDRILEAIQFAEYVVVDLTGSRPNVFYEAGFAQGIGKTPIFVARHGSKLEFDLKDYPVIFFKNMKGLKDMLENRFRGLASERSGE